MTNIICTASIEVNAPKSKVWDALINPVQIKKISIWNRRHFRLESW